MIASESGASCSTTPSPQRYRWFVRLCVAAIALAVLPTALLQGFGSQHGGMLALVYLPVSFVLWQAAQVFLCLSGREVVMRKARSAIGLNVLYVVTATAAVSLFFFFPARFY
jgi:hypothetical protein